MKALTAVALGTLALGLVGCGGGEGVGHVAIQNFFDDPAQPFNPPWTICESSYNSVEFGSIAIGATSVEQEVPPGLDYVLMVAAWDDPACEPPHAVPLTSRVEEEVVPGQHRTIVIGLANHQGPCPPEGVAPIPEAAYEAIRARWVTFAFPPYADRASILQCQ